VSSMQKNAIVLAIVAVLLAVSVYFIYPPGSSTHLGLDLQGGLSVILEAQDSAKAPRTEDSMKQAITIIEGRVNGLGVAEPEIQRQGQWKISVQLPGIANPQEALDVIGKTAVLEFYDTNQFGTAYATDAEALKAAGVTAAGKLPPTKHLVHWPAKGGATADSWFIVASEPQLTGSTLSGADVAFDQNNQPKINMQFKGDGATKFAALTDKMGKAAQITGQDQLLAIVLDGTVQSAPRVQERIEGGRAEITGKFTLAEAKNLALVLKTGALPIELLPVQQRTVGATLGKASLSRALLAGLIGLMLVAVFMIAVYRLLGLIADIALVIYAIVFWGILNAVGVTLTLPGVAGMILTLGMAVDGNVITFARIRDEVNSGKTLRTAIDAGFKKAFSAILDGHVTALITAVVLFWAASGGVRGFALNMGIGVALSLFSSVIVSRALVHVFVAVKPFRKMKLLGLEPRATEMKVFSLMKYRRWAAVTLGAVTILLLLAVFAIGLHRGIEFNGGVRTEVKLAKAATTTAVAAAFTGAGVQDPVVQTAGGETFVITAAAMTDQQFAQAQQTLTTKFAASPSSVGIERIGPSFGQETSQRTMIAILVAIIVMIGYLSFRFEYKFAIPAIIALAHDVALTLAVYAFTGRLVTTATVAAVLTILGYSVNDTIIVFDRIRENTHYMKKESYASMVDLSIRQTVVRSLNTAITMLIPLAAILLFGGPTLKDFAFALVIGVASGAYSSIFIASPLLVIWKERERTYRKRAVAEGA
jgi:SecD/SecF fusion protein